MEVAAGIQRQLVQLDHLIEAKKRQLMELPDDMRHAQLCDVYTAQLRRLTLQREDAWDNLEMFEASFFVPRVKKEKDDLKKKADDKVPAKKAPPRWTKQENNRFVTLERKIEESESERQATYSDKWELFAEDEDTERLYEKYAGEIEDLDAKLADARAERRALVLQKAV